MKTIKVNSKRSSLLAKGVQALLLLLVLQAEMCPGWGWRNSQKGEAHQIACTPVENFREELEKKLQDYKNRPDNVQKVLQETLYILVKNKQYKKLSTFLTRCSQVLEKSFPAVLNAINPKTEITPLGAAIQNHDGYVFDSLLLQEGLDINQAGKNLTSLISTLKNEQHKMAKTLLKQDSIDIQTVDPESGSTTVQLAAKCKYTDIAVSLIEHLNNQAPALLFTQNKKGNILLHTIIKHTLRHNLPYPYRELMQCINNALASTNQDLKEKALNSLDVPNNKGNMPLHFMMHYGKQPEQAEFIELVLKYRRNGLWRLNNNKETVVDVAVKYNQNEGIKLIHEMPLEEIIKKDSKQETLVHRTAHPSKRAFFTAVLYRIGQLVKTDATVVKKVQQLFTPISGKKSIWESIYLSGVTGCQPVNSGDNIDMFKYAIDAVKNVLEQADWNTIQKVILTDIDRREHTSKVAGGISSKYADQLRNIVNSTRPVAAA